MVVKHASKTYTFNSDERTLIAASLRIAASNYTLDAETITDMSREGYEAVVKELLNLAIKARMLAREIEKD